MTRPALTLVELLVALVITTLLAVASLRVVTTLARTERVAQAVGQGDYLKRALERVVTTDLLGAEHFRPGTAGGGFSLKTRAALAPGTLAPEHLPSVVTYEIRQSGARPCLVRRQQTLEGAETIELIAADVRAVAITAGGDLRTNAEGWKETPAAVTVTIDFGKAERAEFVVRKQ